MWNKYAVRFALYLLNRSDLSIEDRSKLSTCVLTVLAAQPLRDIISSDIDGSLLNRGKTVDLEFAKKLRASAQAALENIALRTVHEQVLYMSVKSGFLEADSEKRSFFGKAAVWYGENEVKLLRVLAGIIEPEKK